MIEKIKTKRVEKRVGGNRHKIDRVRVYSQSQKEIRKLKRKLKKMNRKNENKKITIKAEKAKSISLQRNLNKKIQIIEKQNLMNKRNFLMI